MALELNPVTTSPVGTSTPAANLEAAQLEAPVSAPAAAPSLATPEAARVVTASLNPSMSLAAPGAQTVAPRASAVVGQVFGGEGYDAQARVEQIKVLIAETGVLFGGLHNIYAQNQLQNLLWTASPGERQIIAQLLASTVVADPTSIFGGGEYMDRILDGVLTGESWRSFSFFMYQYTAGFNGTYYDPYANGAFSLPDWWYYSRPYDTYQPYWLYDMPYGSPYYGYSPHIFIDLGGRGRVDIPEWHGGNPRPGGGWSNPRPGGGGSNGGWGNPVPGGGNNGGWGNTRPGGGGPIGGGSGNNRPGGNTTPGGGDRFPGGPVGGGSGNNRPGGNTTPGGGGNFPSGPIGGGSNTRPGGNNRPGSISPPIFRDETPSLPSRSNNSRPGGGSIFQESPPIRQSPGNFGGGGFGGGSIGGGNSRPGGGGLGGGGFGGGGISSAPRGGFGGGGGGGGNHRPGS